MGQTTIANIQAGLFYGNLGAIREIIQRIQTDVFKNKDVVVISTGEFAHLFEKKNIFTLTIPNLVLQGLLFVLRKSL